MDKETMLKRYSEAVSRIGYAILLECLLPEEKAELILTTKLSEKLVIMERLAEKYEVYNGR